MAVSRNKARYRILVVAEEDETAAELCSSLAKYGFIGYSISDVEEALDYIAGQTPDMVIVDIGSNSEFFSALEQRGRKWPMPTIALIPRESLDNTIGLLTRVDDFVVKPFQWPELELRIRRLLRDTTNRDSDELIKHGDLIIDLAKCDVTVAGRQVDLTFREYELLKFLATNKGRVHTREALLDKVWGYDYYGGDRTVDVHIRRLRSKIEDSEHSFIETVRNIGYRFKDTL